MAAKQTHAAICQPTGSACAAASSTLDLTFFLGAASFLLPASFAAAAAEASAFPGLPRGPTLLPALLSLLMSNARALSWDGASKQWNQQWI